MKLNVRNELPDDKFALNEIATNRIVAFVSIAYVLVTIFSELSLNISYSNGIYYANRHLYLPIDICIFTLDAIAFIVHFKPWWVKYMLMAGIIAISVCSFGVFTIYTDYYILIPLVVSTRYYNRKIIGFTSITTFVGYIIACIINIEFANTSETIAFLHRCARYDSWAYTVDAFNYIIIPMSVVYIFLSIFSFNSSDNGLRLLSQQAKDNRKISLMEAEFDMAANLQKKALPPEKFTTENGNFTIDAREKTAKAVGGDFYDYFMIGEFLVVLVADVSDKGTPAALFMMSAKKAIRCALMISHDITTAIGMINTMICQDNDSDMFLTLWLGIIDTNTGVGKYVNGGHLPPLLKHNDGSIDRIINEPDMFIGDFVEFVPAVHNFRMREGDTLVLYTDGITDALNVGGNSFGYERFFSVVKDCDISSKSIVDSVYKEVSNFEGSAEQFDDETMLALFCNKLNETTVLNIETISKAENVSAVIDKVGVALADINCPDESRRKVEIVIDEIFSNISENAYGDGFGPVAVDSVIGDNYIDMVFRDNGTPFNPLLNEQTVHSELPVGGLGICFIKNLSDELSYEYVNGKNALKVTVIWDV